MKCELARVVLGWRGVLAVRRLRGGMDVEQVVWCSHESREGPNWERTVGRQRKMPLKEDRIGVLVENKVRCQ